MFPLNYYVLYQDEWWVIDDIQDYGDLGILYGMHDPSFTARARYAWDKELKEHNLTPQEKLGGVG